MRTMAIVPAYNEEKSIYDVITGIKTKCPEIDVVVVNDGSIDNTSHEALRGGAFVINLPSNLGIGGAVQTGYIYALKERYDAVVQVDGDGQHDPSDLYQLLNSLEQDEADMVVGSRFLQPTSYRSSITRSIGIGFFSRIVSILIGKPLKDTTSGYRAVNRSMIELFASYYPTDYPEVETIVYAARKGKRIKEIPVHMHSRQAGKSSITPIRALYYMIKVTLSLILQP